ncbi:MAG: hypothetical protein ACLS8R_09755 [Anaeromassilibacillus sp.]
MTRPWLPDDAARQAISPLMYWKRRLSGLCGHIRARLRRGVHPHEPSCAWLNSSKKSWRWDPTMRLSAWLHGRCRGNIIMEMEPVPTRTADVNERIQANLPERDRTDGRPGLYASGCL